MKKLHITVLGALLGAACDDSQAARSLTGADALLAEAGTPMAAPDLPGAPSDASRAMNVSGAGGANGGAGAGGAGTGGAVGTGGTGSSDAGMAVAPDAAREAGTQPPADSGGGGGAGGPNTVSVFSFTGAALTKEQLEAYEMAMRNGCGAPTREGKPCEIISPPPKQLLAGRCHGMHCCVGCWDGTTCHVSADQQGGIWSQVSARAAACGSRGNDCSMCSAAQVCKQDPVNPSIQFTCR